MPSLLPHGLWGRSRVSLFFASVASPELIKVYDKEYYIIIFFFQWRCHHVLMAEIFHLKQLSNSQIQKQCMESVT
jgi:hypothetical protein